LAADLRRLNAALAHLADAGDADTRAAVARLRREMRGFEPGVTMIGQVKAGKTSLVNAMIGRPGLLPADINPWTSVVTSLHIGPHIKPAAERARFRFFSDAEWRQLLTKGGRVGELAARAGAESELEKVRAQLDAMREKSRARLGRKFEMLMGQSHDYGYVDADLIQRYVCLGDDPADGAGPDSGQGRFADITKSADLYLHRPDQPWPMCIRDTPGVNDTFMVREQITVNAIRASRLCVVVLSAHQALSTVDMALIRLIANIPSRQVILFVNRIDELGDPVREIPQIRDSIRATLAAQNGPTEACILFGSALWANSILEGTLNALPTASAEGLLALAEARLREGEAPGTPEATVWALSGLPALGAEISARILEGEGAGHLADRVAAARNLAATLSTADAIGAARRAGRPVKPVQPARLGPEIDRIKQQAQTRLEAQFDQLMASFDDRLQKARARFLSRATASLIDHLETHGDGAVWTYDPAGLRMLLRSGYQVFSGKATRVAQTALQDSVEALSQLLRAAFNLPEAAVALTPPGPPETPPPVLLGQTIALDIKGSWWSRWWRRRRSYAAYSAEFAALIDAEITPMVEALKTDYAAAYRAEVEAQVRGFVERQGESLLSLAARSEADLAALRDSVDSAAQARAEHLAMARRMLDALPGGGGSPDPDPDQAPQPGEQR
jgi:hypothetical protein